MAIVVAASVGACKGDEPPAQVASGGPEGELGGPCFSNNTCNGGLTCGVVGDTARCVAGEGNGSTSSSSSSSGSTTSSSSSSTGGPADAGSDADSGPAVCTVTPTTYPCPFATCYGQAQSCTVTGCNVGEARWECHAPNDCQGGAGGFACCVPTTIATAKPVAACGVGTLEMKANVESGSTCTAGSSCQDGAAQLCASTSDCPAGQRCTPLKPTNGPATVNALDLGLCTP